MISRRVYLIGLAALFALSGARMAAGVAAYSMNLHNNTEYPVELRTGSTWAIIFPGRNQIFSYQEGVTLRVDGRQLHFARVDPPQSYMRTGLFSKALKAQLNSDLKIWLLPPSERFPAFNLRQQPEGFPLRAR